MELQGRTAVVTGGGSGIGAATCALLAEHGVRAVSWDIESGADVQVDVTSEESIAKAMQETVARWGTPSLLVGSAGVASVCPLLDIAVDDWDKVFAVNVKGILLSIQVVARAMVAGGLDGAMVAVSSINGVLSDRQLAAYSASKAAVYHLSRVAAVELGPYNIRVNAIGPGPTDTPLLSPAFSDEFVTAVRNNTPLGRLGSPELVADGIVNLLRSDWITGQAVMVDGGASLMSARGGTRDFGPIAAKPSH
jgi:NAD(P)-dependent dehydrogenase (short-subunit alcohol dehydrogenase family)